MVYLILLLFLLVGGVLAYITFQNLSESVALTVFYGVPTPELPLGLWLIGFFLLGALLLYLVAALSAIGERRELKKLHKRVAELEQEKAQSPATGHANIPGGPLQPGGSLPPAGPSYPGGSGGRTPTGSLPHNASFIPMPGVNTPPHSSGNAPLSSPEYRQ